MLDTDETGYRLSPPVNRHINTSQVCGVKSSPTLITALRARVYLRFAAA